MKKSLLILFVFSFLRLAEAQSYSFSHFTESYTEFTDGTLMDFDSICFYANLPPLVQIGFQMPYFNRFLTNLRVEQSYLLSDNLSTTPGEEILAQFIPYGAIYGCNQNFSSVRYKTVGMAPNQIFKLQFKDLSIQNDSLGNDRCNYQVWLHEANGRIEFRTGPFQITQDDGYFTFENGTTTGFVLYDQINDEILPGSIFLQDSADAPNAFYNASINFVPTVIGHPTNGRVYRFDNNSLGLEKSDQNSLITLSPNPSSDYIEISGDFDNNTTFALTDVQGKVICEFKEKNLNVTNLSSGIYYIIIRSNGQITTEKMIKN